MHTVLGKLQAFTWSCVGVYPPNVPTAAFLLLQCVPLLLPLQLISPLVNALVNALVKHDRDVDQAVPQLCRVSKLQQHIK
jgi:hypothetical protein